MPEHHPEFDAQTLAEAEAIKADPRRLIGASAEAGRMASRKAQESRQLAQLARNVPIRNVDSTPAVMQSRDGRAIPITRSSRSTGSR